MSHPATPVPFISSTSLTNSILLAILLLLLVTNLRGQTVSSVNIQRVGGVLVNGGTGMLVSCPTCPTGSGTQYLAGAALGGTQVGNVLLGSDGSVFRMLSTSSAGRLSIDCNSGCGGASPFEDQDAFTAGTSSINLFGGVFNDGLSAVTSGQGAAPRITSQRGLHVNLRAAAGTEVGTAGAPIRIDPTGTTAQPVTGTFFQATQPVSVASLPLPSGAATETTASAISGKLPAALVSGRLSVDGSGVTQPVSGTFFQATQPVSNAGTFSVQCTSGCTPGGSTADNSAVTFGTTALNPAGYVFDDTSPNTVTENNVAIPRMSSKRIPYSTLWDAAGNERGANVSAGNALLVDASATTQPVSGTFFQATQPVSAVSLPLPSGASTESTLSALNTKIPASPSAEHTTAASPNGARLSDGSAFYDAAKTGQLPTALVSGRLSVDGSGVTQPVSGTITANLAAGTNNIGDVDVLTLPSVTVGTFPDNEPFNIAQMNGVTITMGNGAAGTGVQRVAISSDNTAIANAGQGAIAAAPPTGAVRIGGTASGATAGLLAGITVCDSFANIQQTAGAQIVTGVSGRRIYVCSINLVSATAQNVAIVAGTGTVCATTTVAVPGLSGGATAATGWNLSANGGIAHGGGLGAIAKTTVNADNLCVLQSSSGQLSGGISYAIY